MKQFKIIKERGKYFVKMKRSYLFGLISYYDYIYECSIWAECEKAQYNSRQRAEGAIHRFMREEYRHQEFAIV